MDVYSASEVTKVTTIRGLLESEYPLLVASFCMILSQILTIHHYYQHRKRALKSEKGRLVNVLFIVPIYGCYSCIMLCIVREEYVFMLAIRDCYGAYALYNFLYLCYEYLGGQSRILVELCGRPLAASWFHGTDTYTIRFHCFCKYAILQYSIVKTVSAVILLLIDRLSKLQAYHGRDVDCTSGYFYLTMVLNASALLALYAVLSFYVAVREFIRPDPTLKFILVIVLIFFTYWQEMVFLLLEFMGVIQPATGANGTVIAEDLHNFVVCIELLVGAVVMRFAFPAPEQSSPTRTVTMQSMATGSLNPLL